ncbi:MAG: enoyl-CoA hydratase/isomerase family protein [Deltaproteobacteria bacterium]|nr:enoyl-CoA hydratase/isomerase family protein [Deltaproteobacteria bacterium]
MAVAMGFNGFSVEKGEITSIVFDQPRVNVLSTPVLNDILRALDGAAAAKDMRVLVITGQGNTFVAGADIKEMSAFGHVEAAAYARLFHKVMNAVEGFARPVIAAVNGFALGGGCELVLASDIAIASDVAVFAQPELGLGIIPGAGATQRLARRIGAMRAKDMILTGRRVYANEALDMGLVNRVVPKDRLHDEVMETARMIASKPGHCAEAAKVLIDRGSFEQEIETFTRMFSFPDQRALMKEFLRKK